VEFLLFLATRQPSAMSVSAMARCIITLAVWLIPHWAH
jgi:hypothetical protein